jgi:glycine cleavage system H protein
MTEPALSNVPDDLRYTKEHEYVARTGDPAVVRIGITDYAQGELGDVVFVNLPKAGDTFEGHQAFGTIEAVKAVSELYAPLAGEVVEVNGALETDPAAVNRDPYGEGWMIGLRVKSPAELDSLLSPADYRSHIGE